MVVALLGEWPGCGIFFLYVLLSVPCAIAYARDVAEFVFLALYAVDGLGTVVDARKFDGFVVAAVFTIFVFEGQG